MCMSFCTLSTAEMASPSEEFSARLNETVIAGNWPWWLMERGSVVFSKWQNALNGTSLLIAELLEPAEPAPVLTTFDESALDGGAKVLAVGVYCAVPVRAFEPAEDDPEAEKEVDAAVPLAPLDVLDKM